MQKIDISLISNHSQKKFMADAHIIKDGKPKPVIIFNHGFKGFKDWGPFDLVAEKFAESGFTFIKMNFSHNGVTPEKSIEFADLEAFANNNFCKELDDTGVLIDHLFSSSTNFDSEMDLNNLFIVGHSRGGASAILKTNEDPRIKSVVTWAAVPDLGTWYSKEQLTHWKNKGRIYIHNGRTNQEMPLNFQMAENYLANKDRLDVPKAVRLLKIPMLAIHGSEDSTVPVSDLKEMKAWNPKIKTQIIHGGQHTFGGVHPFRGLDLPEDLRKVVNSTINFFKSVINLKV